MRELGLRYKGKRCPFIFKNPRFIEPLKFMSNDTVLWVKKSDADWLISNNPRMFEITGDKGGKGKPVEEVVKVEEELIPAEESEKSTVVDEQPPKKKRGMPKGGWPSMKNKNRELIPGEDRKTSSILG